MINTFNKCWLIILALMFTVTSLGWDYTKDIDFLWDFSETNSTWNIPVNAQTVKTFSGLEFHGFSEKGIHKLAEFKFHPAHYAIKFYPFDKMDDTIFKANAGYTNNNRHQVKFFYVVELHDHDDKHLYYQNEKSTESIEINNNSEYNFSNRKDYDELNKECIKSISLFIDIDYIHPDHEFYFYLQYVKLSNLIRLNPEYPDYCEAAIYANNINLIPGDVLKLRLSKFYFGYPEQEIDLVFAFYNGVNVFTETMTVTMPKYTMFYRELDIAFYDVEVLDFRRGINYFTLGVAPKGTLDFLNEIVISNVNYEPTYFHECGEKE